MKIIVKFSPEIMIKSRSVRVLFIKILVNNIKSVLKKNKIYVHIIYKWDQLEISHDDFHNICLWLQCIPGIHHVLLVKEYLFNSLSDIYDQVSLINHSKLKGKSFCIRVKRYGNHNFTSQDVERYLGEKICSTVDNVYVNLVKPEEIVFLEIKNNCFFIIIQRYQGLGGFPIGTQQEFLSLISGGFDSAVASYMFIRRGCKVHYCYFNFEENDIYSAEVYNIAYYLWTKFSSSHKVKFFFVNFSEVIKEIISKIDSAQANIILKRMMIRAASYIALRYKINALITGEVLGQVSSQTVNNLSLINDVSKEKIIFRPLITYDKEKIIELARKIGTEIFSRHTPEHCAISSGKATAKATKANVLIEEDCFNFEILTQAISTVRTIDIRSVFDRIMHYNVCNVETKTTLDSDDIILDIRTVDEQKKRPLCGIINAKIKKIPFYNLLNQCDTLDKNKFYLLYCDKGIMSRLQAMNLYKRGFCNVKVYRPINF